MCKEWQSHGGRRRHYAIAPGWRDGRHGEPPVMRAASRMCGVCKPRKRDICICAAARFQDPVWLCMAWIVSECMCMSCSASAIDLQSDEALGVYIVRFLFLLLLLFLYFPLPALPYPHSHLVHQAEKKTALKGLRLEHRRLQELLNNSPASACGDLVLPRATLHTSASPVKQAWRGAPRI